MGSNTDTLTSLPNDVFTAITEDFDLADLCNLRLTSHNLHAVATTPNFQARFHHIRAELSEDSLRSLIAICSSPDLSILIKGITILAKHYDDQELRQQVKDGTRWEAGGGNGPIFSSTGRRMNDDEKEEAKAMLDETTALRTKQAEFQASGTDIQLLSEALNHLGTRSISFSVEAAVLERPQGPRLNISHCRNKEAVTQIMDHAVKATIAALGSIELEVSTFSIFNKQWGGCVSLKGIHDGLVAATPSGTNLGSLTIPRALHNVKSLTLSLYSAPVKKIGGELDYGIDKIQTYAPADPELHVVYLSSVASLLQPMTKSLQHLEIRFRGYHTFKLDCAQVFTHLAGLRDSFVQLSTLDLHNIAIHNTDLVKILRSTPALTHLGLHKVSLPKDPCHIEKLIQYPDSEGSQMEPDAPSWKTAWKVVFEAFIAPEKHPANTTLLCPLLETLELNGLYLTSFAHRIYFTSPHTPLLEWVLGICNDESRWAHNWFKLQAFQEGLACCVLHAADIRGYPTERQGASNCETSQERREVGWEKRQPLRPRKDSDGPEPMGVAYKVATTRPYGSAAYYQWLHGWEKREFGELGCDPSVKG